MLRARPHGSALEHVSRDVAKVLGEHAGVVPWRAVINRALIEHVIVLDATGWRAGPDLGDVPPIIEVFEQRARALADSPCG